MANVIANVILGGIIFAGLMFLGGIIKMELEKIAKAIEKQK